MKVRHKRVVAGLLVAVLYATTGSDMAQAKMGGGNGPRAGRTTGRMRDTLVNNNSKKGQPGLPSPGYVASLNSQLASLYLGYQSQLAAMKGQRKNIKSDYLSRLAQLRRSGAADMTAAEGQAVERGVLGGGADIKTRVNIEGKLAAESSQALLDKQAALTALSESKITSTNQYYAALADLQAQRTAAMAESTTEAYANDFVDSAYWDWKGDGKNGQVFMRQNAEALQPYYDLASKGNPTDTAYWRRIAKNIAREFFGWTGNDFAAIDSIIMRESRWNPQVANETSSARGIPQTLMSDHFGENWQSNPQAQRFLQDPIWQIVWLMNYIKGRYGTPQAALAFKDANRWY